MSMTQACVQEKTVFVLSVEDKEVKEPVDLMWRHTSGWIYHT